MTAITRRQTLICAAFLALLNAIVSRKLFTVEYTRHMGAIDAAYFGLSRYIMGHWRDLGWFHLWYCGIPFHNSYPPVMHVLVAALGSLLKISPALAHHATGAAFYCLGPVALFLWCYRLSADRTASFVTALVYSLISPSALLVRAVALDLQSPWRPRRLDSIVRYGDGPHVAALALVPLALMALDAALEKRGALRMCGAAILLALVVLTNWLGAAALAITIICYLLARYGEPRWWQRVIAAAGMGLLAYALAAPLIPPSAISDVRRNAQIIGGNFPMGKPQLMAGCLLALAALTLTWLLARWKLSLVTRFSLLFLLFTSALVFPPEWFRFYLMPQPERYQLEMEIAVCMVLVFGLRTIWGRFPKPVRVMASVILICLGLIQVRTYLRFGRSVIQPIAIRATVEYEIAHWLSQALPNARVFAGGSVQFWLNAFTDNPQVGGGYGQGVCNPEVPVMHFGIPFTEHDGARAAMWLELMGARAVVVSGPAGRDAYPSVWKDPGKFRGVLPEVWRDGDDAIFSVPQRSASLAYVIPASAFVSRAPVNVEDVEPAKALAAAVEDPSLTVPEVNWRSASEGSVRAVMDRDQRLFVQISYHPGWKAFAAGHRVLIRPDGLGLMVLDPHCDGPCAIDLIYDGGTEMLVAKLASAAAFLFMVIWCALALRRKFQ